MVDGLPCVEHIHQLCSGCATTKLKRRPFPTQAKRRADGLLDLVHGDICGPISPAAAGGKEFFLLLVDDHSRYMWLSLLANKSDALAAVQQFQARVEVETGRRLRVLRTDNRGEFTSVTFTEHCVKNGIKHQHTAPYTPQQNGVVERRNQSVVNMARSLLKSRELPAAFWGRGGHHCCVPPQPSAHEERDGQDTVRGMARTPARRRTPARLRLRRLCQGEPSTPQEA
jgi:transposase InsO family protein